MMKMQMVPLGYITPTPKEYFNNLYKLSISQSFNSKGELVDNGNVIIGSNIHLLIMHHIGKFEKVPKGYLVYQSVIRRISQRDNINYKKYVKPEPVVNLKGPELDIGIIPEPPPLKL